MQSSNLEEIQEDRGLETHPGASSSPSRGNDRKQRPRAGSRISLEHFNPNASGQLSKTLSRMSGVRHRSSDETLSEKKQEPFDFEETLRTVFQQFVPRTRNWIF